MLKISFIQFYDAPQPKNDTLNPRHKSTDRFLRMILANFSRTQDATNKELHPLHD